MKRVSQAVLAVSAFACSALLSIGWSDQGSISLSVDSAQARVGRPLTPVSGAGVARRQARRGGYYGAGAAVAAGAAVVGTAAAVAATSPYWGSPYATGPGYEHGYYGGNSYAAYGYPAQDYATRNGWVCHPGTMVKLDDGRMYPCQ